MSERVTALLVKAVQQLPPPERDELLAELIGSALGRPAAVDEVAAVVMPTLLAGDRHVAQIPCAPIADRRRAHDPLAGIVDQPHRRSRRPGLLAWVATRPLP